MPYEMVLDLAQDFLHLGQDPFRPGLQETVEGLGLEVVIFVRFSVHRTVEITCTFLNFFMIVTTGFSIDEDLLKELDLIRGDIPRSRVIVRLIQKYLGEAKGGTG